MQVSPNTLDVVVPAVVTGVENTSRLDCGADTVDDAVLVLCSEKISDLTR